MKVNILKSAGWLSYEVPENGHTQTVMQILDYISLHLDHSLAYYKHSACAQGICGRCALKVNGKAALACTAKVEPGTPEISLEPAGAPVVRDLVTAQNN
jgi:succinate dehydrogenase/fumarate reductase-like Fe-S protein